MDELRELELLPRLAPSGVVVLDGGWEVAARVLVRSRIASRLLLPLREFAAGHKAMLYDQVRRIPWPAVFTPSLTMAVETHGATTGADFTPEFAALRIKDALCDEFRLAGLPRPDVDRRNPDVRIVAFFFSGRCELSLDLCGLPLHRRGYREEGAAAPLRENRAAALLRFAGYTGSAPLLDPFCGSGTIAIEAALVATRHAPGLLRAPDALAAVRLFPAARAEVEREREAAAGEILAAPPHPIAACDHDPAHVAVARRNAAKAGVAAHIAFGVADARQTEFPGGFLVTNPPHGERLEDPAAAGALISAFVRQLKHHGTGTTLALLLTRGPLEKSVGLKPLKRLALESGPIGLRFLLYEIYAGSRKPGRPSS